MNIPKPAIQLATTMVMSAVGTLSSMATAALVRRVTDKEAAAKRKEALEERAALLTGIEDLEIRLVQTQQALDRANQATGKNFTDVVATQGELRRTQKALSEAHDAMRAAGLTPSSEVALAA